MVQMEKVDRSTFLVDCGRIPDFLIPQIAYLLADDETYAIIEPGCTTAASRLLDDADSLGFDLEKVAYIIPTHIHMDHAGGAGYLARNLPKAKVVLHPRGAPHVKDPSKLIQATRLAFGENWEGSFGPVLPVPEEQIRMVDDGEVISLGERELTVFFSPGHAPHHISILDSGTGGLFCGESLGIPSDGAPGFVSPGGVPPFDAEQYVQSIEKQERLFPRLIFYSHVRFRSNPGNRLIQVVKESALAFNRIVQQGVEAGEDDGKISERLMGYLSGYGPVEEVLRPFGFDPSGFIDYYRDRK